MKTDLDILKEGMASIPVKVSDIIRKLGITYVSEPMAQGQSGYFERNGSQYTITVNSNEPEQRRRFTAAHELAHYFLHRDMLVNGDGLARHNDVLFTGNAAENPYGPFRPKHEVEANQLAAEIIMPNGPIRAKYDSENDNVKDLANEFGVSAAAMKIRLKVLGLRALD